MKSSQRLPVLASLSVVDGVRSALCLGAAVVALMVAACASVDATSTPYVGAPHPAPTDATTVQILRSEPTKQHDRLGEVVVDASVDPPPPITDVEAKLRGEAAKMGFWRHGRSCKWIYTRNWSCCRPARRHAGASTPAKASLV